MVTGSKKVVNQTIGKDSASRPTAQFIPRLSTQVYLCSNSYSLKPISIQVTSPKYLKNIPVVRASINNENMRQAILIGPTKRACILAFPLETKASKIMLAINGNATNGIEIKSFNQATPHSKKKIANVPTATIRI